MRPGKDNVSGEIHIVRDDILHGALAAQPTRPTHRAVHRRRRRLGGCDGGGDEGHTDPDDCGSDNCAHHANHLSLVGQAGGPPFS